MFSYDKNVGDMGFNYQQPKQKYIIFYLNKYCDKTAIYT